MHAHFLVCLHQSLRTVPLDINPSAMPSCTIEVRFKLLSVANNYGWLINHDNGGYDRGIVVHDDRFGSGHVAMSDCDSGKPSMRRSCMPRATVSPRGSPTPLRRRRQG